MKALTPLLALVLALLSGGAAWSANPPELGAVDWLRDFDLALEEARKTGKPVLLLFQEVPG